MILKGLYVISFSHILKYLSILKYNVLSIGGKEKRTSNNFGTPKIFSTPNMQRHVWSTSIATKRRSVFESNISPFAQPSTKSIPYPRLSHAVKTEFSLCEGSTLRVNLDLDYSTGSLQPKFWRILRNITSEEDYIQLVADWLVRKSTSKSKVSSVAEFVAFVEFLLERFGIVYDHNGAEELKHEKRTKTETSLDMTGFLLQ